MTASATPENYTTLTDVTEVGGWRGVRIPPSAPAQRHPPTPFRKLAIEALLRATRPAQ
jgi:hypothetical protein